MRVRRRGQCGGAMGVLFESERGGGGHTCILGE